MNMRSSANDGTAAICAPKLIQPVRALVKFDQDLLRSENEKDRLHAAEHYAKLQRMVPLYENACKAMPLLRHTLQAPLEVVFDKPAPVHGEAGVAAAAAAASAEQLKPVPVALVCEEYSDASLQCFDDSTDSYDDDELRLMFGQLVDAVCFMHYCCGFTHGALNEGTICLHPNSRSGSGDGPKIRVTGLCNRPHVACRDGGPYATSYFFMSPYENDALWGPREDGQEDQLCASIGEGSANTILIWPQQSWDVYAICGWLFWISLCQELRTNLPHTAPIDGPHSLQPARFDALASPARARPLSLELVDLLKRMFLPHGLAMQSGIRASAVAAMTIPDILAHPWISSDEVYAASHRRVPAWHPWRPMANARRWSKRKVALLIRDKARGKWKQAFAVWNVCTTTALFLE